MKVLWLCQYPLVYLARAQFAVTPRNLRPATWLRNLAYALRTYYPKIELHVITETALIDRAQVVEEGGVTYHLIRSGSSIPFTHRGYPTFFPLDALTLFAMNRQKLQKEIERINPDIIHAHGTESVNAYVALGTNYPVLVSIQGIISEITRFERHLRYRIVRRLERDCLKAGKYFVATTLFAEKFIRSLNGSATIFRIENPMDEVFFSSKRRTRSSAKKIVFVGYLAREKGIEDLLAAVALVNEAVLYVVGMCDRRYLEELQGMVNRLGITERVNWLGTREPAEIAKLFESASLLALPSYVDNSPSVVCEALCSGVPVVATKIGGIPDLVTNGKNGLLVEVGNVHQLAGAIQKILADGRLASAMGTYGRKEGLRRFHPKVAAHKTFLAYNRILESTR